MATLFISNLVPDKQEYWNPAFTRSAQNVLRGIAKELPKYDDTELACCLPTASFPHAPLWIPGKTDILEDGQKVHIWPTLNIQIIKIVFWGIYSLFFIAKWAKRHKKEKRRVLGYNTYTPPVKWLYRACRRTQSKLHIILMDLGVPPARLGLSKIRMWGYKSSEKDAHKYIPKLDGRIVINENMVTEYAPGMDYVLVDGGINDEVIKRLFSLKESHEKTVTYVLAGMLWDQNGTKLVLDALKSQPELDIKVIFAGKGNDVPLIEEAAKTDARIQYVGMLNMDELFRVYESADVLLNLRIEEEIDMHFPSKLLECLTMGKLVLSTPVAHAERDYGQYMEILHDMTPEGLAQKMQHIASRTKSELLETGIKARHFMLENRTWEKRTKEIMDYVMSK